MEAQAALVTALAWPTVCLISLLLFRKQLSKALERVRGVSLGSITAELTAIATTSIQEIVLTVNGRETAAEKQLPLIKAFDRIWRDIDQDQLKAHVEELARSYEIVRNTSGNIQDQEVIAARLRFFAGFTLAGPRPNRKTTPGNRLAYAVALQVLPNDSRNEWLGEHVAHDHGVIGYHAALALKIAARSTTKHQELRAILQEAKAQLGHRRGDRFQLIEKAEEQLNGRGKGRIAA